MGSEPWNQAAWLGWTSPLSGWSVSLLDPSVFLLVPVDSRAPSGSGDDVLLPPIGLKDVQSSDRLCPESSSVPLSLVRSFDPSHDSNPGPLSLPVDDRKTQR